MNTEHLFGIYWGAERLREAEARRRREWEPPQVTASTQRTSVAARDAAYERLFDAVRRAVQDSRSRL